MAGLAPFITWVNTRSRRSFVYCHLFSLFDYSAFGYLCALFFNLQIVLWKECPTGVERTQGPTSTRTVHLTIITPLMQRVLQIYSTQPQSILIDSSASCDQVNTSLTLVLIATKAGAVSIGVSLHDSQTESSYNTVFSQLRESWVAISPIQLVSIMADDVLQWKMHLPPFGLEHCSYYACFMFCRHCGAGCGTKIIVYPRRREKTWWMTSNELCIQHRW